MKKKKRIKKIIVCQTWDQMGQCLSFKPDGYSLHLNETEKEKYIKEYWRLMPPFMPDEYSRPSGSSYKCQVSLSLYQKIKKSEHGLRFYKNSYPKEVNNN